jgi:DNA modification methylase
MKNTSSRSLSLAGRLRSSLLKQDVDRRADLKSLRRADTPHIGRNDPMPAHELVYRNPTELHVPKRNVRKVKQSHVKEVMNSIQELGFRDPVVIDAANNILDGVVRIKAAIGLGLTSIPCFRTEVSKPVEGKLIRQTLNRMGEKGEWDTEELKVELEELILEEAPIHVIGFEVSEIDGLLAAEAAAVEPGPIEREHGMPVSRLSDIFILGRHRVVCGDARESAVLSRLMGRASARLVLTDEPFNVRVAGHVTKGAHREFAMASGELSEDEFLAFNEDWLVTAMSHLMDGGLLTTAIDWRGLSYVTAAALSLNLEQINLIVWSKSNAGMGSLYRSQHELFPLFKKGTAAHLNNIALGEKGRWRSNVWIYPGASTIGSDSRKGLKSHPTVKPVALLADAMLDLTNRDDVVLDPFLGSGSTLIAAEQCGRVCYGVELDPLYVDVIVRRYQQVTGRPATLEASGETFDQLAERRAQERASTQPGAVMAKVGPISAGQGRLRPARLLSPAA